MAKKTMNDLKCMGCGYKALYKEFMPWDIQRSKARCPKCGTYDLKDYFGLPVNNEINYQTPKGKRYDKK